MSHPTFKFTAPPTSELLVHERENTLYQVQQVPKRPGAPFGHQSLILGGAIIAQARAVGLTNGEYWCFRLQYHGGRKTWMLESERVSPFHIFPRDDEFGQLPYLMDRFQQRAGLNLPPLKITTLGRGITNYTADGQTTDPANPSQLEAGKYEFMRGYLRCKIEALEERGVMVVRFIDGDSPSETFDPNLVLDATGWLTLTKTDSVSTVAADTRRPRP